MLSLFPYFLNVIVEKWKHFLLKCSLGFTSETIWAWCFLFCLSIPLLTKFTFLSLTLKDQYLISDGEEPMVDTEIPSLTGPHRRTPGRRRESRGSCSSEKSWGAAEQAPFQGTLRPWGTNTEKARTQNSCHWNSVFRYRMLRGFYDKVEMCMVGRSKHWLQDTGI